MEKIIEFRESFVKYLNNKIKIHRDASLKLQNDGRNDEAIFEKIKESALVDMICPMFVLTVNASIAFYMEDKESKYGKTSDRWIGWIKIIGDVKSIEERIYKLFIYNWIEVFKDETKLKKSEEYNDQMVFMKEKSKIDIINEVADQFKKMVKGELGFEESQEVRK